MVAIDGELCMKDLWRGWHFTMIGMMKLQDICSDKAYELSSNGNACVLLTSKNFQLVLLFQMPWCII